MKNQLLILATILLTVICVGTGSAFAQSPQMIGFQAVVFDSQNALVRNTAVGMQISILQGSATGTLVFQETYSPNPQTNGNGVVSIEIGSGNASVGIFSAIDWSAGPYFIKSETDILGGTNYTITGVSQLLSAPFALYANTAGNGFSGDYNDLTNQPLTDGSETKVIAGSNVSVSGTGTNANPYVINSISNLASNKMIFTATQLLTIPQGVTKIKVELWGGAGGGGGGGAYAYSYYLNSGGDGGSGGYAMQDYDVTAGEQYNVTVGEGGIPGVNAIYSGGNYYGDTDGGNGNDSHFSTLKAAGGGGGKRGSYAYSTISGYPGIANEGTFTASSSYGGTNKLEVFSGFERSYLAERLYTSIPGKGGAISSYSGTLQPTAGEGGCAAITFY